MPPTRKELILALIVLLTIPVVAEVALHLANVQFEPQLYTANRELGWSLRPGAEGVVTGETRQYVNINSLGFHDAPRAYDKPANTFRIAVLGNSWTEALQVPVEKNYCSVLERKLNAAHCFSGKRVEVLNFGVSGYSTAQELLLSRQEVWKYHPDMVIVAFYSARDIANNLRQFNNAADPEQSPYFVFRADKLVLDDSFKNLPAVQSRQIKIQKIRAMVNDHILVLKGVNALVRFGRTRVAMAAIKQTAGKESAIESTEHAIYTPPSKPAFAEAWRVTEALLTVMHHEALAHNAVLRIVTLANRPQVIPDPQKRLEFTNSLGVSNLSYADERINALGAREGIPVINLAPALSQYAETQKVFLNGFNERNLGGGHWNETGHRVAAETIAEGLCSSSGLTAAQETTVGSH